MLSSLKLTLNCPLAALRPICSFHFLIGNNQQPLSIHTEQIITIFLYKSSMNGRYTYTPLPETLSVKALLTLCDIKSVIHPFPWMLLLQTIANISKPHSDYCLYKC